MNSDELVAGSLRFFLEGASGLVFTNNRFVGWFLLELDAYIIEYLEFHLRHHNFWLPFFTSFHTMLRRPDHYR